MSGTIQKIELDWRGQRTNACQVPPFPMFHRLSQAHVGRRLQDIPAGSDPGGDAVAIGLLHRFSVRRPAIADVADSGLIFGAATRGRHDAPGQRLLAWTGGPGYYETTSSILTQTSPTLADLLGWGRSGWPSERVVIIDCDQGQSAAVADRAGFQQWVTEVGLGRAGIVLGLEVSRLARSSRESSHHLPRRG